MIKQTLLFVEHTAVDQLIILIVFSNIFEIFKQLKELPVLKMYLIR
jgi:hypothetical protein